MTDEDWNWKKGDGGAYLNSSNFCILFLGLDRWVAQVVEGGERGERSILFGLLNFGHFLLTVAKFSAHSCGKFEWISWIPLKVNCFILRLKQNKIPVLNNLVRRGISVGNMVCKLCHQADEDTKHIFFHCSFATKVWKWFADWSKQGQFCPSDFRSLMEKASAGTRNKKARKMCTALCYTVLWVIWKWRNEGMFNNKKPNEMKAAEDIQLASYNWIRHRSKTSAVCGPYLQISAEEEVDQTSAVCKKKTVYFLTSADC
ncbi:hypothetical protein LXL04_027201 [Taraxacum kok-saghyz]